MFEMFPDKPEEATSIRATGAGCLELCVNRGLQNGDVCSHSDSCAGWTVSVKRDFPSFAPWLSPGSTKSWEVLGC